MAMITLFELREELNQLIHKFLREFADESLNQKALMYYENAIQYMQLARSQVTLADIENKNKESK